MAIRQPSSPTAEKPAEIGTGTPMSAAETPKMAPPARKVDSTVRGQVRMHAIIAGYTAAARLAPTLATTPATVKEELHKMAAEIAAKVESYSFQD